MKWVIGYFVVGFIVALISYRLHRRDRNVRNVKKIGGVFTIIMFYTWLWVFGLAFDLVEVVSKRKAHSK